MRSLTLAERAKTVDAVVLTASAVALLAPNRRVTQTAPAIEEDPALDLAA
jgi:hypothetical protein